MVEEAQPTRSDPSPGSASGGSADRDAAKVASAAKSSSSGEQDYEAEPDQKVSEEALKGPQGPPPPEYEFEKQGDGRGETQTGSEIVLFSSVVIVVGCVGIGQLMLVRSG